MAVNFIGGGMPGEFFFVRIEQNIKIFNTLRLFFLTGYTYKI
jgi:hypothetical protein